MADDAEPVAEVKDDATKTDEVEEIAAADAATDEPDKGKAEQPKPGTPDKALQKMQQELGNVTRQLAALTEKKDAGHELSEADKAKLAKAQQRHQKIQQFVGRPDRQDTPSDVDDVAEEVLDLTKKVGKVDRLEAELAEYRGVIGDLLNDRNWSKARTKYAGLDVDAIWTKAQSDAGETLADDGTPRAIHRLASKLFEERCEAAKKRKGDVEPKPLANNKTAAPTDYRVGSGAKAAPVLSEDEEALAEARSLVREI